MASSQRLHPTPEPVPPQYFTSVPGRLPVSQPLSSPHTPTRPQRVGSGLEPSTTHLDDVIAHVVSDAVAYANQPGDSGSSMSPRHRKLQPPGSYASNQINDSSTPFKISENPAMPVGRSPVLSQDPGEPRITGHSSGSVTFVQDFSTGTYGYGAGVGGGRANAYVASRFSRRSPIQSQQQHCTSPGMQQVGSQHCSVMYANAPVMRPSPSPVDSQHPEYVSSPYDHHQQQLQSQNVDMNSGIFGTHNSEVSPSSTVFPSEMHSPSPHSRPSYSSQTVAYNYVPQSPYASQSGSEGTPSSHIRMTPMNCFEEASDSLLEQENNRRAEELSTKVKILKSYAHDIRDEANQQNEVLDKLQSTMDSAGHVLGNTVGRVFGIPANRTNNRKLCCYTPLVFIGLFFLYRFVRLFI
ncbi:unnamed protein product [Schistocephalus solidus]|uniref:t-SNARE coiled-coil homology domain-containing protein n=1 Tax=Schistocephalus solidus TaxID=70667 RepID=A0A3P7D6V7_SCHSO|nr:unnamed protein product [Schistocephalus solidus]